MASTILEMPVPPNKKEDVRRLIKMSKKRVSFSAEFDRENLRLEKEGELKLKRIFGK